MLTILIAMIAGAVLGIIYEYKNNFYPCFFDYLGQSMMGIGIGMIIGLILAMMLPMKTYEKHYTKNIECLQDNNTISGNLFIGTGQIEGKMKYTFYYQENGLIKLMQLDCDEVKLKYSEGQPIVNVTEICPTIDAINLFGIDGNLGDKKYIIEIPRGTIKNNYNLDAQ